MTFYSCHSCIMTHLDRRLRSLLAYPPIPDLTALLKSSDMAVAAAARRRWQLAVSVAAGSGGGSLAAAAAAARRQWQLAALMEAPTAKTIAFKKFDVPIIPRYEGTCAIGYEIIRSAIRKTRIQIHSIDISPYLSGNWSGAPFPHWERLLKVLGTSATIH